MLSNSLREMGRSCILRCMGAEYLSEEEKYCRYFGFRNGFFTLARGAILMQH